MFSFLHPPPTRAFEGVSGRVGENEQQLATLHGSVANNRGVLLRGFVPLALHEGKASNSGRCQCNTCVHPSMLDVASVVV